MILVEKILKRENVKDVFEIVSKEINSNTVFLISEDVQKEFNNLGIKNCIYTHVSREENQEEWTYRFKLLSKPHWNCELIAVIETKPFFGNYYKITSFADENHYYFKAGSLERIFIINLKN